MCSDPCRLGCNKVVMPFINPVISSLYLTSTELAILEENAKIVGDSVMLLILYIHDATSPIPALASTNYTGILHLTFH
jgi:hypothetical protein